MTESTGVIVVGVDGSTAALEAVRWAAAEAAPRHVALRLVSGTQPAASFYGGGLPLPQEVFDAAEEFAERHLAEAAAAARATAPGVTVEVVRERVTPIPLLLGESERARMIVLGASGSGGFEGMLAGSVPVAVAARSGCPVAVVRAPKAADGPVVVGVDGSPLSVAALGAAFDEAAWRGAPLVAVHAWSDMEYVNVPPPEYTALDPHTPEREHARLLAEGLAGWQEKYPDVGVERVVVRDRPRQQLLEWSEKAQLVVVGSRGRGGFRGLLLGSTSQALLHHAHCPVLVVRP